MSTVKKLIYCLVLLFHPSFICRLQYDDMGPEKILKRPEKASKRPPKMKFPVIRDV